ncbi:hypothetical protein E2562_038692 [Oryza meyeriana var. granulata]|uniref:Uncharacterized protein n=1 Tax=Oryza meyeriana var. granulata TaxID=110450 RepID=A0A6G1CXT9_9ORYZ|nr:hypothetical protein E2562_038692 [Oryza meyeriana var. granulata]
MGRPAMRIGGHGFRVDNGELLLVVLSGNGAANRMAEVLLMLAEEVEGLGMGRNSEERQLESGSHGGVLGSMAETMVRRRAQAGRLWMEWSKT